jgi:hypothetical protein
VEAVGGQLDGAYVVSDVVVVGGLDQQVAEDAVELELGSDDLLVAVEESILNTRDTAADAGRARGQGETLRPSMSESFTWHTTRR